jgi:serine/threonine protein kinase
MGEVYSATDTRLDRTVAIKVLPEAFQADADRRQRFDREAKAIAALNHPHICALYDIGREGGTDFLVMEHLVGDSLQDRLRKGAVPLDQALEVAIQLADALDKAHHQGITHRDLKPGNIFLTKSGAKLLDFGLAKVSNAAVGATDATHQPTRTADALTAQGTILGTFHYMSPEQLEGREADARSDIWAFGCVLHEMVTGRRAFDGASQATLIHAIMGTEPAPVSVTQPVAPASLDHVVKRCLAKDPDDRWQTMRDVRHELRWVVDQRANGRGARATGSTTRRVAARTPAAACTASARVGGRRNIC